MGVSNVGNKSICLPVPSVAAYEALLSNPVAFRRHVNLWAAKYPEIFPAHINAGFWFHDFVVSRKLNLRMRRIRLLETGQVYQLRPEFVMPYMVGQTDEVEKGLYLRRYGVRFDALAYVFGHDASYWYRLHQSLGRFSLVGTTVRNAQKIPLKLVADEKHSWRLGRRIYIPTTVAAGCILGVDAVESADTKALVKGYGRFRAEVLALHPDYQPQTVNTDGWEHTQAAWQTLFRAHHDCAVFSPCCVGHSLLAAAGLKPSGKSSLVDSGMSTKPQPSVTSLSVYVG